MKIKCKLRSSILSMSESMFIACHQTFHFTSRIAEAVFLLLLRLKFAHKQVRTVERIEKRLLKCFIGMTASTVTINKP